MYSKEQMETRLRLGHGLSPMELGHLTKHLFNRIEEEQYRMKWVFDLTNLWQRDGQELFRAWKMHLFLYW